MSSRMQFYSAPLRHLIYTISLIYAITFLACSNPATFKHYPDTLILEYLSSLPELTYPLETESNKDNYGFILTKSYCENVAELMAPFKSFINLLIDSKISAQQNRVPSIDYHSIPEGTLAELKWVSPHIDNISSVTLFVWLVDSDVTSDDRYDYLVLWNGPAYEAADLDSAYGFILPGLNQGLIRGLNWRIGWAVNPIGIRYNALSQSWIASVLDSTSGGGTLVREVGLIGADLFQAFWDTLGHGTYYSNEGSGSW